MRLLREIKPGGILLGAVVQTIGSLLSNFLIGTVLSVAGLSPAEIEVFVKGDTLLIINLVIGLFLVALGGWIAGHFARRAKRLNGGLAGTLSLMIALPFLGGHAAWFVISIIVMAVPAGVLGGYLAYKWRA